MTRAPCQTHQCNVIRDGIEFAATYAKGVVKAARGCMSVVVRDNGKLSVYRRGSIPAKDVSSWVGTYNGHTHVDDILEDMRARIAEITVSASVERGRL